MSVNFRWKLRIDNLLTSIDCERFPEAYGYLCQVAERQVNPTPFEMASVLIECDKPRVFPLNLIAFITQLYEMEIEEGNAAAMNDLGSQYYDGHRGFEQNFTKAVKLYQMAAESGNRQAQENLGYCYYYGRDMPALTIPSPA